MLVAHELTRTTPGHRAEPVEIWKTRKFIQEHSGEETFPESGGESRQHSSKLSERKIQADHGNEVCRVCGTYSLRKACGLLHDGKIRISEIAFAVGFQSLSQFNRVFKKFSGKSPTQYREAESVTSSVRRTYAQFPFNVVRPIRAPRIAKNPSAAQESRSKK